MKYTNAYFQLDIRENGVSTGNKYTMSETSKVSDNTVVDSTHVGTLDISNVYYKGSLTINKSLYNSPDGVADTSNGKKFSFIITYPDGHTETKEITGSGSVVINNLPLGTYKVVEDKSSDEFQSRQGKLKDKFTFVKH